MNFDNPNEDMLHALNRDLMTNGHYGNQPRNPQRIPSNIAGPDELYWYEDPHSPSMFPSQEIQQIRHNLETNLHNAFTDTEINRCEANLKFIDKSIARMRRRPGCEPHELMRIRSRFGFEPEPIDFTLPINRSDITEDKWQ